METKSKNPNYKYWSKTYKGILKQITRQNLKPNISKVVIIPIIMSYSSKHSEYRPLKRKYCNYKYLGGKGLDKLYSDFYFQTTRAVNGMYTRCLVDKITGKYKLSKSGRETLQRYRNRRKNK